MSDDGHEEEEADRVEATRQRPPNLTCEQALAAVPPPNVALLAAELMSEPAGMKEKRRRGRPKGKHCDARGNVLASKATERAYRLLTACYHEKQQRLKTSRYMGLASLSLTAIAQIALVPIWDGESLEEGVSTAITLLEVAECGQLGLGTEDSYHSGIDCFLKGKRADWNCQEEVAQLPKVKWPRDEHRRKLLEPFETWLRILIPLGDRWKSRADEKRNASSRHS